MFYSYIIGKNYTLFRKEYGDSLAIASIWGIIDILSVMMFNKREVGLGQIPGSCHIKLLDTICNGAIEI